MQQKWLFPCNACPRDCCIRNVSTPKFTFSEPSSEKNKVEEEKKRVWKKVKKSATLMIDDEIVINVDYFAGEQTLQFISRAAGLLSSYGIDIAPHSCHLKKIYEPHSILAEAFGRRRKLTICTKSMIPIKNFIIPTRKHEATLQYQSVETVYALLIGIRTSVMLVQPRKFLSNEMDKYCFDVKRIKFPPGGSEGIRSALKTQRHNMLTFYFKEYAPEVFASIRYNFNISSNEYIKSFCSHFDSLKFTTNSKNGEFFCTTKDQRFDIKTISMNEKHTLLYNLAQYYKHMITFPSFLTPIYGLYEVNFIASKKFILIVTGSPGYNASGLIPDLFYELKGLTYDEDLPPDKQKKKLLFNDVDFSKHKSKIKLGRKKDGFLEQINRDLACLNTFGVQDYSLMLGIQRIDPTESSTRPCMKRRLSGLQHMSYREDVKKSLVKLPQLQGGWDVTKTISGHSKVQKYTMTLSQDKSKVTGFCSNGFCVEGNISQDGTFRFLQTFGSGIYAEEECECIISSSRVISNGKWKKINGKEKGSFGMKFNPSIAPKMMSPRHLNRITTMPSQIKFVTDFKNMNLNADGMNKKRKSSVVSEIINVGIGGNLINGDGETYLMGFTNYLKGFDLKQQLESWDKGFTMTDPSKKSDQFKEFFRKNVV